MGASGLIRGKDFCQDYFEDYYECVHHYKSNLRVWKMQEVQMFPALKIAENVD